MHYLPKIILHYRVKEVFIIILIRTTYRVCLIANKLLQIYRIKLKTVNLLIKFDKFIDPFCQYEPNCVSFCWYHYQNLIWVPIISASSVNSIFFYRPNNINHLSVSAGVWLLILFWVVFRCFFFLFASFFIVNIKILNRSPSKVCCGYV